MRRHRRRRRKPKASNMDRVRPQADQQHRHSPKHLTFLCFSVPISSSVFIVQQHHRLHHVSEYHHCHSQHGWVTQIWGSCCFIRAVQPLWHDCPLAEKYNFLGISIVGQSNERGDGGIYIGSIMKGGAVAADGRIEPGDMLLQVCAGGISGIAVGNFKPCCIQQACSIYVFSFLGERH